MARRKALYAGLTEDEMQLVNRAADRTPAATRSEFVRRIVIEKAREILEAAKGEPEPA